MFKGRSRHPLSHENAYKVKMIFDNVESFTFDGATFHNKKLEKGIHFTMIPLKAASIGGVDLAFPGMWNPFSVTSHAFEQIA